MRTPFVRKEDVAGDKHPRNWWIVDAEGKTLGRVATQIARALRGLSLIHISEPTRH